MLENVANKLSVHYFFDDDSHTMDASVRNKCEHEVLMIAQIISKELKLPIKIQTEPPKEGGFTDFYNFLLSPEVQAMFNVANTFLSLVAIGLSRLPSRKTKLDKKEQLLNIAVLEKTLEEYKQKELENPALKKMEDLRTSDKLIQQANDLQLIKNLALAQKELPDTNPAKANLTIEKVDEILNDNIQIQKHKSNFYKQLLSSAKISSVETTIVDSNNNIVFSGGSVTRAWFNNYIVESDELPSEEIDATIEIVAPVLKQMKGNFKWKGILIVNGESKIIDFNMKSEDFKKQIQREELTFKSGSFIDCVIEISRKIDESGVIYNSAYSVVEVKRLHSEGVTTEIKQSRKGKKRKPPYGSGQIDLFGNSIEGN